MRVACVIAGTLMAGACAGPPEPEAAEVASSPEPLEHVTRPPVDLRCLDGWGGLYARDGDQIVDASAEDVAVAKAYPRWTEKGPLTPAGERLTIMTTERAYLVGEPIRVCPSPSTGRSRRCMSSGRRAVSN